MHSHPAPTIVLHMFQPIQALLSRNALQLLRDFIQADERLHMEVTSVSLY